MTEEAEIGARHENRAFVFACKCRVGAEFEFPFVIFHPTILLLHLLVIGSCAIISGEILVILAVPKRIGRSGGNRKLEIRTSTRENGIVYGVARKAEAQVEVVAVSVGDNEVLPRFQVISLESCFGSKCEIIVGPAQTFAPT